MVKRINLDNLRARLNSPEHVAYSRASTVSVAIGSPDPRNPHQFHIGLLYRFNGNQYFLHLAWHNLLKNDLASSLEPIYYWIDFDLPEVEKQQLAMQCHRIYQRNGRNIPYGVDPDSAHIDPVTAKFVADKPCSGLTCATFVLEVFENFYFPLIVREGWPRRRKQTRKWQRGIVKGLEGWASKEHIESQLIATERGCMRFPPHEVAAAASASHLPQRFAWIIDGAEYIQNVLLRRIEV